MLGQDSSWKAEYGGTVTTQKLQLAHELGVFRARASLRHVTAHGALAGCSALIGTCQASEEMLA